jgi:hypothetical protein
MCLLCIELNKTNIRSKKEFDKIYSVVDNIDLDHWFDTLGPLYESLPDHYEAPAAPCSCGARFTSFPGHHLKYCQTER